MIYGRNGSVIAKSTYQMRSKAQMEQDVADRQAQQMQGRLSRFLQSVDTLIEKQKSQGRSKFTFECSEDLQQPVVEALTKSGYTCKPSTPRDRLGRVRFKNGKYQVDYGLVKPVIHIQLD